MTSRTVADFWKRLWFAGGDPKRNAPLPKQNMGLGRAQRSVLLA